MYFVPKRKYKSKNFLKDYCIFISPKIIEISPRHAAAASEALRLRLGPRLRFSDISNKILESNIRSCGLNGAVAAQNLSRRVESD